MGDIRFTLACPSPPAILHIDEAVEEREVVGLFDRTFSHMSATVITPPSRFRIVFFVGFLIAAIAVVASIIFGLLSREQHLAYLIFLLGFPFVKATSFMNAEADRFFPIFMFLQLVIYGAVLSTRWQHPFRVYSVLLVLHCCVVVLCFRVEWQYVRECLTRLPYFSVK